jgi:hypothetical protein
MQIQIGSEKRINGNWELGMMATLNILFIGKNWKAWGLCSFSRMNLDPLSFTDVMRNSVHYCQTNNIFVLPLLLPY